jgi:hypothetical protein
VLPGYTASDERPSLSFFPKTSSLACGFVLI